MDEIFICQMKYTKKILKKFNMENCKSTNTPMCQKEKLCKDNRVESLYRSLIGYFLYLTVTKPNIMYAISVLSRFINCAKESHFKTTKTVM
jgi:hypothetical protein